MAICNSTRSDGALCKAAATAGGRCFWHATETREAMLEASRRGGARRALQIVVDEPMQTGEGRGLLSAVIAGVLAGAVDPTTARTIGYLLQVDRQLAELDELVRRLDAVEMVVVKGDLE